MDTRRGVMDRKGMTLVELLVYIVLAALLLAPVIMLMQNSSVTMARDAGRVNLNMTGRELLGIIYDDLKNTGFKLDGFTVKYEATYRYPEKPEGERDSASFMPGNKVGGADYYDTLTVLVGVLNSGGGWAGVDTVTYKVNGGRELVRRVNRQGSSGGRTVTLARNVAALKFRYSPDLVNWYDKFDGAGGAGLREKHKVQYVKAIVVLKDSKRLSPVKPAAPVTLITAGDGGAHTQEVKITPPEGDLALYERYETLIPIPNNGLFP
jgi:type II secretory pathway pseudopilin PulG